MQRVWPGQLKRLSEDDRLNLKLSGVSTRPLIRALETVVLIALIIVIGVYVPCYRGSIAGLTWQDETRAMYASEPTASRCTHSWPNPLCPF